MDINQEELDRLRKLDEEEADYWLEQDRVGFEIAKLSADIYQAEKDLDTASVEYLERKKRELKRKLRVASRVSENLLA